MHIPPTFEIRVALIGYVSVGKTTILNALFGAKYGEVAMKRTTAVVNNFRINSSISQVAEEESPPSEAVQWATTADNPRTASTTLQETIADNALHRNSHEVSEKTYDIVLPETFHEMRQNTKLVIVDIPGINEAGASSKYRDYVNDQWRKELVVLCSCPCVIF